MKTNRNVSILLENGFHFSTISKMKPNEVKLLAEKFFKPMGDVEQAKKDSMKAMKAFIKNNKVDLGLGDDPDDFSDEQVLDKIKGLAYHAKSPNSSKLNKMAGELYRIAKPLFKGKSKETKEAVQTVQQTGYKTTITPGSQANLNVPSGADISVGPNNIITMMSKDKPVGTGEQTESKELDERFASKAQQKLFFVKCGAGKTKEEKKWCKMRDEFAASTKKMDYKKMPEKLHPEKTVKYKKKRTDENYEQYLENRIFEMIENHIEPSMTKGDLLKTIQEKVNSSEKFMLKSPKKNTMFSENEGMEMKKPIGKVSSFEVKENTKEKEAPTKPGTKSPGKRKNPFKDPNPGVEEKPKASTKEKQAPTKPGTKTPTRRKGNPFKDPNPGVKENPKAEDQKNDFMSVLTSILNK